MHPGIVDTLMVRVDKGKKNDGDMRKLRGTIKKNAKKNQNGISFFKTAHTR